MEVCRFMRLINALQEPDLAICMTMAQVEASGPAAVLRRLVKRHQHLLAYRAASMLGLSPNEVPLQH